MPSTIGPVSITNPGTLTNYDGDVVSYGVSASDTAGNPLSYSAVNLPLGESIDPSTGIISGTIYITDDASSPYSAATVTATDTVTGASASATFTWDVLNPVSVTAPSDQYNYDGDTGVSLTVSATDADSNSLNYTATGLPPGLGIGATTGIISPTIDSTDDTSSPYSVTVTATDTVNGASATTPFNWYVSPVTVSLSNPGDQSNYDADTVSLSLAPYATDSAGHTLAYNITGGALPDGLGLDLSSGIISGTITDTADAGSVYSVTVQAADSAADVSASQTFNWTVANPVTLTNPGDQTNYDGDTGVSLPMSATDADSNALTYTAGGLPPGLTIDANSGIISGTVTNTDDANSPYSVTVTATDAVNGASAQQQFDWTVNNPVALANPGAQSSYDGDNNVSVQLSATDANYNAVTYAVTSGALPAGLSLDPNVGDITGNIAPTADLNSPYSLTITATDSVTGLSDPQSFDWTVSPVTVNLTNPGSQYNYDGDSVSLQLNAVDNASHPLAYSITAGALPAGLSLDPSSGLVSGNIASNADSPTPYSVTIKANDSAANVSDSQTFIWTVTNPVTLTAPVDQTNYDGDTVSLQVSASDAIPTDGLNYTAMGLPPGLNFDYYAGTITGTIAGNADSPTPYSVSVTATDSVNGASVTQTFNWTVNNPVALTAPANQTNYDGDTPSLQLSATDAVGNPLNYTAGGLPSGLSMDYYAGTITGTIAGNADSPTPYSVSVTATDSVNGASVTQTFNWTVNNPVALTAPSDQTNFDGDTVSLPVAASDADGNALSYSETGLPSGLSMDPSVGDITGTISPGADTSSPYSVTVTATDSVNGANDSQTFNWTVSAALVALAQGDQYNTAGDTVSVALYSWGLPGHSLIFSASGLPSDLTIDTGTGTISGNIPYAAASSSPYSVTVTATDSAAGVSTNATFNWNVAAPAVYLSGPSALESVVGASGGVSVVAVDTAAADTLTYTASGLPLGVTINASTGEISGTIDSNADENSPYSVTVTATDEAAGVSASVTFPWTVSHLVVLNPGDQADLVDATVSLAIQAPYADSGTLVFSTSGLPSGLSIDAATGVISGTIACNADAVNPYSVTVTATDGTLTATKTFAWNVQKLFMTNVGNQFNVDGDVAQLAIPVTAPAGHTVTLSVTGLPEGTYTINNSTQTITFTVPADADETSPYQVTITATDTNNGASVSQAITWTVEPNVSACAAGLAEEEEEMQQQSPADLTGVIRTNAANIAMATREIIAAQGRLEDHIGDIAFTAGQYATTNNAALRAIYARRISILAGRAAREISYMDNVGQQLAAFQARRTAYLLLEAFGPLQFLP